MLVLPPLYTIRKAIKVELVVMLVTVATLNFVGRLSRLLTVC
jgi:hypothetical protein